MKHLLKYDTASAVDSSVQHPCPGVAYLVGGGVAFSNYGTGKKYTLNVNSSGQIESTKVKTEPDNNEIWYTSTNGNTISNFDDATKFGDNLTLVSNTYTDGKGIAVYSGDVTKIEYNAFYECSSLTSITIPSSVASIKAFAFEECTSLASIAIPSSVTSIEGDAFYNCTSLPVENNIRYTSLNVSDNICLVNATDTTLSTYTIKEGTKFIGYMAFADCTSLASITISSSVTSIGDGAFQNCSSLASITIPSSVTRIGDYAFAYCAHLTSITIPSSVTSIGNYAFSGCSGLTSITIPSSVTGIASYAFYDCSSLASITIPSSVTSIGDAAFGECSSLASITIPSSVTSIGGYAFEECTSLASITISSSVTSIGDGAFQNCSSLASVYVNAITPPTLGTYAFYDNAYNRKIYVPSASVDAYKAATNWSSYASDIVTQS